MNEPFIPLTYEDISNSFPDNELDAKLMEFIEPDTEMEFEINTLCLETRNSGKVVFLLGRPGTGKSTFIHSLKWRPNIALRTLESIDMSNSDLQTLLNKISEISTIAVENKVNGPTAVIINYLENFQGFDNGTIKSFFRNLNGILRKSPLLIIWPVTEKHEVDLMMDYSRSISGTLFVKDKGILNFTGPKLDKYVDIAKRTVTVLNAGKELDDFNLTHDDFVDTYEEVIKLPVTEINLREYYKILKSKWQEKSGYLDEIRTKIPKPTEVWFLVAYKNAEDVVAQFSRKTTRIEDAWSAITDKFSEYINNNQRSERWNARKMQLAFYGALKTRVMYMPTNTLISVLASYSDHTELNKLLNSMELPSTWKRKHKAIVALRRSPIYRQLVGEIYPSGKRKGGPTGKALEKAAPYFEKVVNWISQTGTDKPLNKSIASALFEAGIKNVSSEKSHPWIPNIYPDVFIELEDKQICIEFHYTNKDEPNVLADYVLRKLDVYMAQLSSFLNMNIKY